MNISANRSTEAVIQRMIELLEDLEQRIEALEAMINGPTPTTFNIPTDLHKRHQRYCRHYFVMLGEIAWSEADKSASWAFTA